MESSSHDRINLAILARLREADAPVSGEILGTELGLSRVALWKRMENLRHSGCTIQSSHQGYRLVEEDLLLSPDNNLPGPLVWTDECDSTMDRARQLAFDQAVHGTLVMAERQKAGRGQQGRSWLSPSGGIYASLILRSPLPLVRSGALVAEAACFICTWLKQNSGMAVQFQWPNDLMTPQGKLGGLLVETWGSPDLPAFQILGIGLNRHGPDLPDRPVTGLRDQGVPPPRRRDILSGLARHLTTWSLAPAADPLRWMEHLSLLGNDLSWTDWQGKDHQGHCTGLDEYASLLLADGQIRFGESRKIRPA